MDTLFLNCSLSESCQQDTFTEVMNYFGRDFNLKKKIFSNDLNFITQQSEKELVVLTTSLTPEIIKSSNNFKKLCVININPWADVLEYTSKECFSLRNISDIRQKYGTILYTNKLYSNQNFILDRYDIFGFNKAVFIFSSGLDIDIESYKLSGFNFIGIVTESLQALS